MTQPAPILTPSKPPLGKRHCDNCHKLYQQKQRLKKNDKFGFCCPNCKKEFHKHGGSYGKLKPYIDKQIERRIKELSPADSFRMGEMETRLRELERVIEAVRIAVR